MEITDYIQILCIPGNGLDKCSIKVEWRGEYGRQTLPIISDTIENEWNKKLSTSNSIWNGSKFRLHRLELQEASIFMLPEIKLLLGSTCYKDFIGTNCAPGSEMFVQQGEQDFNNCQAYMSDPLGVGGLVVTSDDNIIFIRRSGQCAEFPFLIDRPGGHPEPDDVIAKTGQSFQTMDPSIILEEIFDSILKEITEEVNIPLPNLSSPILLGVSYNPITLKTPSLEFYLKCDLNTNEIQELYEKRVEGDLEESTELIVLSSFSLKYILHNEDGQFFKKVLLESNSMRNLSLILKMDIFCFLFYLIMKTTM
ncbi:uridine diphosphate glucose pyrophosphatase NUDT22 [Nephila pilipes]|uniref:Uridine diphosphate glucose pyrophosphatase NUDT22 n=1 Tax=Nephila pilipes TaxID=299642 RepID=A0A8X6QE75_NEPPI|nr:uridine diphosphate glucose pyrophosphatase NUDT22 [Nephila pilipes]